MKLRLLLTMLFLFGLSWTVAAQDDFPDDTLGDGSLEIINPELIIEIDFSEEDDWEFYEDDISSAQVDEDDEVYVIQVEYDDGSRYLWGQNDRVIGNVVIQIDTEQLSRDENNGYGVLCRADPSNNGNGYRFYISGNGYAAILRIDEDDAESLVEWTATDAINQGRDENQLTIVCVDDYLAFYINGELVAEAEDDTYDEGVIALAASIFEEDEDVEIAFDNLLVWEVEAGSANRDGGRTNTSGRGSSDDADVEDLTDEVGEMLEDGDVEITLEDVLLVETWDELGEWEEFDEDEYTVEVDDDIYVINNETDANLVWALNRTEHDDVVMRVEIEHLSDGESNGFGLMCRVDPDNFDDGYSFLVRPNGTYSIGYWQDNSYTSLVGDDFESNSDIDEDDEYTMTVVCVGEYLALYINGELIDEAEDDTFDEGYAGVAAISFSEDGAEVAFDNLVIWEGND